MNWVTTVRYHALFAEAGGLEAGNDVKISGIKVGDVSDLTLRDGKVIATFTVNAQVELGNETTATSARDPYLGDGR